MSRMYSYSLEGSCPGCGKQFDQPASLLVNDTHHARVNDDGRVVEGDTGADLILDDFWPNVICTHCDSILVVDSYEES